jgi:cell division protein FtsW (lipid II flippase)
MLSQWLGMVPLIGVTLVFVSAMMSVLMTMFERR